MVMRSCRYSFKKALCSFLSSTFDSISVCLLQKIKSGPDRGLSEYGCPLTHHLRVVTQRSSPALRDDTKNGCVAGYDYYWWYYSR